MPSKILDYIITSNGTSQSSSENWACNPSPRKRKFQLLVRVVGKTPCRWLGRVGEFPILIVFCCLGGSMNSNLGGAWIFSFKAGLELTPKAPVTPVQSNHFDHLQLQPRKCTQTQNVLGHALQVNLWIRIQRFSPRQLVVLIVSCCHGFASWTSRSQELGSFFLWQFHVLRFNMQGNITKAFWEMPCVT